MAEAKDSTEPAVAGSAGGGLERCFPPTPKATRKTTRTGIQDTRSYLRRKMLTQISEPDSDERLPVEKSVSAK